MASSMSEAISIALSTIKELLSLHDWSLYREILISKLSEREAPNYGADELKRIFSNNVSANFLHNDLGTWIIIPRGMYPHKTYTPEILPFMNILASRKHDVVWQYTFLCQSLGLIGVEALARGDPYHNRVELRRQLCLDRDGEVLELMKVFEGMNLSVTQQARREKAEDLVHAFRRLGIE